MTNKPDNQKNNNKFKKKIKKTESSTADQRPHGHLKEGNDSANPGIWSDDGMTPMSVTEGPALTSSPTEEPKKITSLAVSLAVFSGVV